jgi:hypothetical protein
LLAIKATVEKYSWEWTRARAAERGREDKRREEELATLSARLSAATARFVELAWEFRERVESEDFAGWLGYRCGITSREAREYLRVAEALEELPAIRRRSRGAGSRSRRCVP